MNISEIFNIKTLSDFNKVCLEVFHFQAEKIDVYKEYLKNLCIEPQLIQKIEQIPFLPISFFKTQEIRSKEQSTKIVFTSSGTTGTETSKHYVEDLLIYQQSFMNAFTHFYGNIEEYCILALLPSYLEREGSSLIYMAEVLIKKSNNPDSGFYLHNIDELAQKINAQEKAQKKTLLIGVSFALLSLIEKYSFQLKYTVVMETGGMKGKRKELTRQELHSTLSEGLGVRSIHSEYGMTELLSQAYSQGNGIFRTPAWMKIRIRDTYDPFGYLSPGKTGGINVIDLANINSCAFIETQDLGKLHPNGDFEILGRFDNSTVRGCNLLIN